MGRGWGDDLYSIQGRLLRAGLIQYWKIFHGHSTIKPDEMFTQPVHGDTRGHHFKINVPHVTMGVCKRSFSYHCVTVWNRLPDSVVNSTDLKTFKAALSHAIHDNLYSFVEWLIQQMDLVTSMLSRKPAIFLQCYEMRTLQIQLCKTCKLRAVITSELACPLILGSLHAYCLILMAVRRGEPYRERTRWELSLSSSALTRSVVISISDIAVFVWLA